MNSFVPRALRVSCLNTRTFFRTCPEVDSLAARLARPFIRPYSITLPPLRQPRLGSCGNRPAAVQRQQSNLYLLPAGIRTFASRRPIIRFEDLPSNYIYEDGIPFRDKPLSQPEAVAIFGGLLDADAANRLLKIIHGRRVAGTLEDPNLPFPAQQQAYMAGLKWLRQHVPMDEIRSAGLRAELELAEMEQSTMAKAEELKLYKPSPLLYKPNSVPREDVYGKSGLDIIRKAKEKEWERKEAQEQARMREVDEIQQNTGTLERLSARSQVELRRPGENPRLKYYLERAKVLPDNPPEMSKFQRLWPSGLVVLLFIGGCIVFASVYTPPRKDWRLWPDLPPSAATVLGIGLINLVVLGAWRFPPLFRTLNKYFITVPGYPFPLSLIGNNFSHQTLTHFSLNMAVLWFVGTRLHEEVGRGNFLAIYLACGAFGSFTSLASWVLRNNLTTSSLGASGALCGILAAYLLLNGSERVTFFGFPPDNWKSLSATWLLVVLIGLDIINLKRDHRFMTADHWAHLGGYASGIVAAEILKMRARQSKEVEMESRKNLGVIDKIREGRL
jgi:rhomboid-like protein